jgi:hypothetical protein
MRVLTAGAVAVLLAMAAGLTLLWGYADRLFHSGSPDAVRRARQLAPQNALYWANDPDDRQALERAVQLNPRLVSGWIALGLRAELEGDLTGAERLLLQAAKVDQTYEPRWTLANFYYRRANAERFWFWARQSAAMAYSDQTALFLLCWRVTEDADTILSLAIPDQPQALAQYLTFLLLQNKLEAAVPVAERLAARVGTEARPLLLSYCDRLIWAARPSQALRVWNVLCERGALPARALSPLEGRSLTNADFSSPPLGAGFDWRLGAAEGISFVRLELPPQIKIAFTGRQPENCRVLEQIVPLAPSRGYRLRYEGRSEGLSPQSGLTWRVGGLDATQVWASAEACTRGEIAFTTPADATAGRIALCYERALGTTRIEGSLWLRQLALEFQ